MLSILPSLPRPIVTSVVGIWRRRWMVIGIAWAFALAGWIASTTIPDMYESRAQVYFNTETALDDTLSQVGNRPNLEKQVRILRTQLLSRDNIEQVIYEVGLDADLDGPIELAREIDELAGKIEVESEEEQYFIISYLDTDPAMAQRVVAAVLDLFIDQNLSSAIADIDNALASLDREISERKINLDAIDDQISAFRSQNIAELTGANRLARRLEAKEEELARIQDQIATASVRRERLANTLSTTPRYTSGSDIDVLKLQLATLQSQFNENYPDIVRLKAQIAELESGSAALPQNPVFKEAELALRLADDDLRAFRRRADRAQTEIDTLSIDVAQTPEAEQQLLSLLREKKQIEDTYSELQGERTQMELTASINLAGGAIEYRRFEAPKVAAEPSWPPRGLVTLVVLAMALGAGVGLAFVLSQLDKTYTQPSDLEEALGLPVLGSVSPAPTLKSAVQVLTDRTALLGALASLVVAASVLYWWYELRIANEPDNAGTQSAAVVTPQEAK